MFAPHYDTTKIYVIILMYFQEIGKYKINEITNTFSQK